MKSNHQGYKNKVKTNLDRDQITRARLFDRNRPYVNWINFGVNKGTFFLLKTGIWQEVYCPGIAAAVKAAYSVTMNIFRKNYFLFKAFVKVELSYVFTIKMFSTAENYMEKWIILSDRCIFLLLVIICVPPIILDRWILT